MIDRRRDVLEAAQALGRLSTVVGAVFDRWDVIWAGAAGEAGLDAQFRIGSITKSLTTVLTLQARDAGLLRLDDTLGDHLGPVGYAECTLRDLLSHRSGMQSEPNGPWWERHRGVDLSALLAANDGSGRVAGPGQTFHYSNLGFALVGAVLEQVRGHAWRDLVRRDLLEPLGMRQTSYLPRPHAVPGWSVDHFTGVRVHEPLHDTGAMAPAGQLWSTVGDLVLWGQFLAGGRPDVLAAPSLDEMRRPTSPDYALGLHLGMTAAGPTVGHTGSMPGFMACVMVEPGSGLGGAVLTNATTGVAQQDLVEALVDGDGPDRVPAAWRPTTAVPESVRGATGVWFWGNSAHTARWHNDRLELESLAVPGDPEVFEWEGTALRGTHGYHCGETLHVLRDATGEPVRLECATFVWTRTPYPDGP